MHNEFSLIFPISERHGISLRRSANLALTDELFWTLIPLFCPSTADWQRYPPPLLFFMQTFIT